MTTEPDVDVARARSALAAASACPAADVELLIEGLAGLQSSVLLVEWQGLPRFVCDRDSAVASAACVQQRALLRIRHSDDAGCTAFAGRLQRLPDCSGAAVVGLALTAVFVTPAGDQTSRSIQPAAYCPSAWLSA